jgi:hypothetical protein
LFISITVLLPATGVVGLPAFEEIVDVKERGRVWLVRLSFLFCLTSLSGVILARERIARGDRASFGLRVGDIGARVFEVVLKV